MYDCWNEAVAYLKNKYGTRDVPIGMNFSGGLTIGATRTRATNTCGIAQTYKTHKMINDGKVIDLFSHDDKVIDCLLGQYYYGIDAKKELYYKLIDMKIIQENLVVSN
jgi:hypothetical protein